MSVSPSSPLPPLQPRGQVRVALGTDERELLARLAAATGVAASEVLREGVHSYAREHAAECSAMLRFLASQSPEGWPPAVTTRHDEVLSLLYRTPHGTFP